MSPFIYRSLSCLLLRVERACKLNILWKAPPRRKIAYHEQGAVHTTVGGSVRSFENAVVGRQRVMMDAILCWRKVFALLARELRHNLQTCTFSRKFIDPLRRTAFASAA